MTFPTVRPARPAYPPPVPSGFIDPGGTTPVEHDWRTLQSVYKGYTDWRAAHPKGIAPDVLRDNAGVFAVSDAALALPPVLAAVQAEADAANKKVNDLISSQKVDTSDVAAQLAADRYWRRAERTLDAIKDPAKVGSAAQDLIANADDSQIPVVSEELAPYLQSRNIPTGWLPAALSSRIPGLSDAQAAATLAARQAAVLTAGHQNLTRAMQNDVAPSPLLSPYSVNSDPYDGGYSAVATAAGSDDGRSAK